MSEKVDHSKYFILFGSLLLILVIISVSTGSVYISPVELLNLISNSNESDSAFKTIFFSYRLPKMLTALFAGSALGFAGLQMQTLFRNPLAGPFVLGISSGASLGVAILVLSGIGLNGLFASYGMATASIIGSSSVLAIILLVSFNIKDSMSLLLIGIMFGAFTSALVSVLQYFSSAEDIQSYLFWTFGATGNLTWSELRVFIPLILLGIVLGYSQIKQLNVLLLGEYYAKSMGLKILNTRIILVLSTSILAGIVTAFCGPIAFIGLAIPHFSRLIHKTSHHKVLVPSVLLIGACALLLCDIIAQLPGLDLILPINAITSLFGAPIVIWLIIRRKNITRTFG